MSTRSTSRALLAALVLAPAACAQIFGVDEDYRLAAGGSSSSGTTSTSSSSSGSAPCTNVGPVTLATVASSTGAPTGTATQRHVFWSPGTKLWWFFYIDGESPSSLQAVSSPDFMTWSPTQPLSMPSTSTSHGSSFSVDVYSPPGGADVAEIAIGLEGTSDPTELYPFRARLLGATAVFDTPYPSIYSDSTGQASYNDHVSIAASDDGYLAIASGLFPSGGDTWTILLTTSRETDDQGWVPTWGAADNISLANTLSRQVVSLGGDTFMTLADDVSTGPPKTVSYGVGTMSSSSWTPSAVPFDMLDQDTNGWSAAVSGQTVHLVRYHDQAPAGYDRAVYAYAAETWTAGVSAPAATHTPIASSGVLTAIDGNNPVVVILDSTAGHVFAASLGKGWAWTDANLGGSLTRQSLSGYSVAVNGRIAVTWTDTSGPSPTLWGALICVP